MNVSASVVSPLIFWFAIAIASGIALFWFAKHYYTTQLIFERINNDLFVLSSRINDNCDANYFSLTYNPFTEDGNLIIGKNFICMYSQGVGKCVTLFCGPDNNVSLDLSVFTTITIERDVNGSFNIVTH